VGNFGFERCASTVDGTSESFIMGSMSYLHVILTFETKFIYLFKL